MASAPNPLGPVAAGALAGAAGTLAMDLLWYRRYRRQGGDPGFKAWEFSTGTKGFDEAGAPAQVGRKVLNATVHREPAPDKAGLVADIVHWSTGVQWGAALGLIGAMLSRRSGRPVPLLGAAGPLLGSAAFAAAYTVLPRLGVYKPISQYDRETLTKDYTAHLVYGAATGAAYTALETMRRA